MAIDSGSHSLLDPNILDKHQEYRNKTVPNFIPELYASVSNKTRLIFYHWLHYHYYSRILLESFLFIDACHWARYAFPSDFVVALTHPRPPLCTSKWHHWVHSDARAALTFTGAGPTDPSTSTAQRSDDCEKVFPSLFMVIRFGSTCFRSLGSVSVGRGMKVKSIFCYAHILSVSDVDEFKYGAEPERSVDQRAWLRGWPMCDTCL